MDSTSASPPALAGRAGCVCLATSGLCCLFSLFSSCAAAGEQSYAYALGTFGRTCLLRYLVAHTASLRVLAGRVVVVRLREELSATGVLRPINQRTDMSSKGQPGQVLGYWPRFQDHCHRENVRRLPAPGRFKYGLYEVFPGPVHETLREEASTEYKGAIWLAWSASAESQGQDLDEPRGHVPRSHGCCSR